MKETRIKHLEFIQAVVSRMSSSSFALKGWAVTLVAALFALAAKDANQSFVLIGWVPIIMFWWLDSRFLLQEWEYRELYKTVASKPEDEADFDMDASKYKSAKGGFWSAAFSGSLLSFYGVLFVISSVTMFFLRKP